MSPTVSPQIQLPLPMGPALALPPEIDPMPLPPRSVWAGLAPPERAQLRQTLVALLEEVVHVHDAR